MRALQFLSTASPGTLGAIAAGIGAVVYLILGRMGLLIIGAFCGVVAFIAWEARNPEVSKIVRGEKAVDVLERLLLDLNNSREAASAGNEDDDQNYTIKNFDDFRPETREALAALVDAIVRDYVKWWYNPIIPSDHSFPLACRKTLTSFLLAMSNHLYRKRPADAFLDLLTNSSSIIIVFLSELSTAFSRLPPDCNMTAVDTIYDYLASNPDCRLASLLNQRQQNTKFKMVAEDLLGFLERNSYNCDPARIFMREIFSNSVLEATLQTCSKAEWINGWIVYLLEAGEPDLSQAIDVGMQTGPDSNHNVFIDMDGNVGNVGIAKPSRTSEAERGRRKESLAHRKKLSRADEELEEAMEEMKRMNAMMANDDARRRRNPSAVDAAQIPRQSNDTRGTDPASVDAPGQRQPTTPKNVQASSNSPQDNVSRPASMYAFPTRSDGLPTSATPRSPTESSSPGSSPRQSGQSSGTGFTSFDQIMQPGQGEEEEEEGASTKAPLTLHNASFTLNDEPSGDKGKIRSKPMGDYLIQVEPSSSAFSGWMIVRRYADFQTLHEILRRIATISGATAFTEQHKELPSWKIHTRESLRGELERYLRDACWFLALAESEGMKRFLEKSQGHTHTNSKAFAWETVGKNMLDVLTTAPKGAMEGGKTLVGGVSGVFGNFPGLNKKPTNQSVDMTPAMDSNRLSISTPPRMEMSRSPARSERASMDSQRSSVVSTQPSRIAPMERRPSYQSPVEFDADAKPAGIERVDSLMSVSASARQSRDHSRASSLGPIRSPSTTSLDHIRLPPPPSEMPDDYGFPPNGDSHSKSSENVPGHRTSYSTSRTPGTPAATNGRKGSVKPLRQYPVMSEPETRVAVELIFAVINEMYTLSSAWVIRRTLLTAAKSFLLRPGNPSLLTVQSLMQTSVLDANTSDTGIATQLRKLRENTMPTDEERATWPPDLTADEKEKLAAKARKLLIRSGVPAALMGVMGQAATADALGRVFDCLQIEEVARGLFFGLMLQAAKILTH